MRVVRAAVIVALALGAGRAWGLSSGTLLTNFVSASFALPGGTWVEDTDTGRDPINVPNSASCWCLVTDTPQLCFRIWKYATDGAGTPLIPSQQYAGGAVCFTIGFSNCGNYSGWAVTITDVMPGNMMRGTVGMSFYASGAGTTLTGNYWATALSGPWSTGSPGGIEGPLYMRWIINRVGMHKTGAIRYCGTIL